MTRAKRNGKLPEGLPEGFLRPGMRIHFVGIGGSGMSGIAEICLARGFRVSGSDRESSENTRRLARLGARIGRGHRRQNVDGADLLVYSSAVTPDNPELLAARAGGIRVIPRAEMLAEIIRRAGRSVIVAGAHGKTTTTSLIGTVFSAAGLDPTVVVGGKVKSLKAGARLGRSGIVAAESDESDGSFLRFFPSVAVVTNLDREHLSHYGSMAALEQAFAAFLSQVDERGLIVACGDDPRLARIVGRAARGRRRVVTYGLKPGADWTAEEIAARGFAMEFEVCRKGRRRGRVRVGLSGRHNVLNALAVFAVAEEFGVGFKTTASALAGFSGVGRRFQVYGEKGGVLVVDDYGHHPTEIRATLRAAREAFPSRRLVVVFQPHRYSRTRDLCREFAGAFRDAQVLLLTGIYPASEKPIPGINGRFLAGAIRAAGQPRVIYVPKLEKVPSRLREVLRPGDLLLTLGAGSIYRLARKMCPNGKEGRC